MNNNDEILALKENVESYSKKFPMPGL